MRVLYRLQKFLCVALVFSLSSLTAFVLERVFSAHHTDDSWEDIVRPDVVYADTTSIDDGGDGCASGGTDGGGSGSPGSGCSAANGSGSIGGGDDF